MLRGYMRGCMRECVESTCLGTSSSGVTVYWDMLIECIDRVCRPV